MFATTIHCSVIKMPLEKRSAPEAATGGVLEKKVFLETSLNSQENICAKVSFLIKLRAQACNFVKKETLAQVLSCEISQKSLFYRTPLGDCFCSSDIASR